MRDGVREGESNYELIIMKQLIVVAIFGRLKSWRIRISAHIRGEESHP